MFRENGFKIAFYAYWIIYLPILLIYSFEIVLPARIVMSIGDVSISIIPILSVITFLNCKVDDYNMDYFGACSASFIIRTLVIFFRYWGLTNPSYILLLTFLGMIFFFILKWLHKQKKEEYFNY